MKTFIKKWNKSSVEDYGGIISPSFKQFARELGNAIKRELKTINPQAQLVSYSIGHYEVSGFVKENEKYVYFSYDVPRGEYPMDLEASNCHDGWLVRTATSCKDYTGGMNNFTNAYDLVPKIVELLEG